MTWLREHYHRVLAVFWLVMLVPTILWWNQLVVWVAIMSIYANFEASMAAHAADQTDSGVAEKLDELLAAIRALERRD